MIDSAAARMSTGQTVSAERIAGVNDDMLQSHYHPFFEIYYLESGERIHVLKDKLIRLSAGDIIIFPPYTPHHSFGEKDVPFRRICFYFTYKVLSQVIADQFKEDADYIFSISSSKEAGSIRGIISALLDEERRNDEFSPTVKENQINLLLSMIFRSKSRKENVAYLSRITDVTSYINKHYEEDITLEKLASVAAVSQFHLCREFKKYMNMTPVSYINLIRVQHAQRLFLETDKNLSEISYLTGFSNLTHFNRVFKALIGESPSRNRKNLRLGIAAPASPLRPAKEKE